MTVENLCENNAFTPLSLPFPKREINGVYIGDLLSWVMGRADVDNAWITIMSNINVVAVAALADVACVILAESVKPEPEILKTAEEKGINIISTEISAYDTAITLNGLLK